METNEDEQKVVRLVNRLYAKESRLVDICRHLSKRKIKTRTGRYFSPEQVRRLIDGYKPKFSKNGSGVSREIQSFVRAIA